MEILTFGTGNAHKLSEAIAITGMNLQPYSTEDLRKIDDACGGDLYEIQSMDITKIVQEKAKKAYEIVGRPVIVEDTGLFIDSLNGFPGPLIKYVLEGPGLDAIFKMMEGHSMRTARAITGVSMFNGTNYISGYGSLEGSITSKPRGDKFGWSNAFQPLGSDKTFGEMSEDEKNLISMRRIALLDFMQNLGQR